MASFWANPPKPDAIAKSATTGHEYLAAPVQVTQAPAKQQEASKSEGITGDDPLKIGVVYPKVMANEGERNIGDRAVEHDHQLSDADQHQSPAKVLPRLLASLRFRRCADVVVRAHEAPGAGVDWSDWLTCNRAMAKEYSPLIGMVSCRAD